MGNYLSRGPIDGPASPPKKSEDDRPVGVNQVDENVRKLGLTQVYPNSTDAATKEKEIDIIVIHGLDARSDKTFIAWRVDGDKESGDVHWLSDEDMLPSQVPQARVLTYDWNANYDKTASKETLRSHADTLLERIILNRDKIGRSQVPIIFIASCFGGVLLSAALVGALELQHPWSNRRRQIFDSCVGVVFLGTPFGGSWDTGTKAARLRIEAAKRANPEDSIQYSMELVQYLKKGTVDMPSPLDDLVHRFQESTNNPKFRIPCSYLYETKPAKYAGPIARLSPEDRENQETIDKSGQGIVVSQESATLGGGDRSAQPMRHNMMHKYNSPDNPAFQSLCLRLKEFVEGAKITIESRDQARLSDGQANHLNELQAWSELLSFSDMDHRRLELEQTNLTSGTCEWLFSQEQYTAWESYELADSSSSTLIIEGKAGSGKSTLMYEAAARVKSSKSICLSYFFDAAKDEAVSIQITPQGLYRSLLSQLLRTINRSPDVMALTREWGLAKEAQKATLEDIVVLKHRLTSLLATIQGKPIRLFVDAIDECGKGRDGGTEDTVDMLEYLQSLQEKGLKVLVLFSIRDRAQYGSYLTAPCIDMSQHNQQDISKFLNDNLKYSEDSTVRQQIIQALLRRSCNVFLWAKLVVRNLNLNKDNGLTDEELRREADRMPEKLESLYQDLINNLGTEHRSEALILLRLVQVRMRPLDVLEIRSALEYATGSYSWPPEGRRSEKAFEAHIRNICRGLIEIQVSEDPHSSFYSWDTKMAHIDPDRDDLCELPEEDDSIPLPSKRLVQFTHESVRDFLGTYVWDDIGRKSHEASAAPYAHFEVSKLCMQVVEHAKKDAYFLPYASHFWSIHARNGNDAIEDDYQPPRFVTNCSYNTEGVIARFKKHANEPYSLHHLKMTDISNTIWLDDKATMLMLLSSEGCGALITKHGELCTRKDCRNDKATIDDAFALALLRGWKVAVEAVRDLARKRSIQLDPTIKPRFTNGNCPLRWTCLHNRHDILEAIIDIGWDKTNTVTRVSFCQGVLLGYSRIIDLFLNDAGDDVVGLLSWQSEQGYTALHCAASAGRWPIFDKLLEHADESLLPDLLGMRSTAGETVLEMAKRGKQKHQMRRNSDKIIETIQRILKLEE